MRQEKGYCGLIWTPTDRSTTARHSNFQLSRDTDVALAGDIDCELDYLIIEESRNYGTLHPVCILDNPQN